MHRPWSVLANALDVAVQQPPTPDTFERILERVEHHAADRCAVVVVDDAHLADAESLAGLRRWLRPVSTCPCAWCCRGAARATANGSISWRPSRGARDGRRAAGRDAVRRLATLRLGREPTRRCGTSWPSWAATRCTSNASWTMAGPGGEPVGDPHRAGRRAARPRSTSRRPISSASSPCGAHRSTPAELSALAGLTVAATMRAITERDRRRRAGWSSGGRIEPASPTHGAAAYERLAPGMRQYLHAACLDHLRRTAPTTRRSPATCASPRPIRRRSCAPSPRRCADAPGVAADVLAAAATTSTDAEVAAAIAVERAAALARSGQMAAAAASPSDALDGELPIDARATLLVLLVLSLQRPGTASTTSIGSSPRSTARAPGG